MHQSLLYLLLLIYMYRKSTSFGFFFYIHTAPPEIYTYDTLSPDTTLFRSYGPLVAAWAYAMLVVLIIATCRHRQRLRRYGADPAWYWQLPPAYRCGAPYDATREMGGDGTA